MRLVTIATILISTTSLGSPIPKDDMRNQNQAFRQYWGRDFDWEFSSLPVKAAVPTKRVPYSGYIYPDTAGGTRTALRKYDAAFHGRRTLAADYERWDTTAFQEPIRRRGGLFGLIQVTRMGTPHWHGHCNGWTSAAIRHAEPRESVTRNGVSFSPAEIKALLAEIYIYNDHLDLSGSGNLINAGLFHAVVANWLGRAKHPLGMESHPGEEKWNYPIYAFNSSSAKRSDGQVEVKLNLASAQDSQGEFDKSPRLQKITYLHYMLELDSEGNIVGGRFFGDSARIDMLWLPLRPKLPGEAGHERGNPHVDVSEVLAIWRASVPEDIRAKWPVADPAPEDRLAQDAQLKNWMPVQVPGQSEASAEISTEVEKSDPQD